MNFSSVLLFGLILLEFARNKRKSKVKYIRTTKSQPMKCVGEDGRTDGRMGVRSRDDQNFSPDGQITTFSYVWLRTRSPRARMDLHY